MERKRNALCYGESSAGHRSIWKVIWTLNIPPKVRHFIWRACRNILPVRTNLCRRGIGTVLSCPQCDGVNEDVYHALVLCPAAKAAWFASPLGLHSEKVNGPSFVEWFEELLKVLDNDQVCVASMVAWGIWNTRNGSIHGDSMVKPEVGMRKSLKLLSDLCKARDGGQPSMRDIRQGTNQKWESPPNGVLKLNCDASVKSNEFVGVGFVVCDCSGVVIASGVDRIMGNLGVNCAEALAVRCGLLFISTGSITNVMVESDCRKVIHMLNEPNVLEDSYLSTIIDDCKKLAIQVGDVSFVHGLRHSNKVAHGLASLSQSLDFCVPMFWLGKVHSSISHLVILDILIK